MTNTGEVTNPSDEREQPVKVRLVKVQPKADNIPPSGGSGIAGGNETRKQSEGQIPHPGQSPNLETLATDAEVRSEENVQLR